MRRSFVTMTEHLIELVRCEPCLYDTNHPDYSKKTLKDLLWVRIAKELNYKDGPSAKDAWLKLRNCHRDAIRRRNKINRSGSAATVTKPWKFEKQMDFLVTYMTNGPTTGNISTGNPSSDNENLIQPEDFIQEDEFESSQVLPPDITGNNSTEDSVMYQSLPSRMSHVAPPVVIESTATAAEYNLNTLIANTLHNHENRAKERAEKRAYCDEDEENELQHFFNTMYAMTKKMPALSRHKLKRRIFNLVSDEEEYLLHMASDSKDDNSADRSTLDSNPYPATPMMKPKLEPTESSF